MTAEEQLQYESRVRTRQTVIAAAAGLCVIAATMLQLGGPHTKVDELTLDLITAHKRYPLDLLGAIFNACGFILIGLTLVFLLRITRARTPQTGSWIRILTIIGAALAAISGVMYAVVIAGKASDFVSQGNQTYEQAHQLTKGAVLVILPLLGQFAALLLAISVVMTALNAMRAGLLTKFLGYLGIFAGVLVMFPIGAAATIVQGFWLLALAVLISGRWPGGNPPAWSTGQAERWPTAAEIREERTRARGGRAPGRMRPAPTPEPVGAPSPVPRTRATSKRKRKKRH